MTNGILQSYQDAADLANKIQLNRGITNNWLETYRGQPSDSFKLRPSFSRAWHRTSINIEKSLLQDFEDKMNRACKKKKNLLLTDRWRDQNLHSWEIPIQAQHLGLPTRLLDWSFSWEYALYFAVESHNNENGQFWVLIPKYPFSPNFLSVNYHETNQTYFVKLSGVLFEGEEALGEQRRNNQFGIFTVQSYDKSFTPLEEQGDFPGHLAKYLIPAKCKRSIRKELKVRGITWQDVYERKEPTVKRIVNGLKNKYGIKS